MPSKNISVKLGDVHIGDGMYAKLFGKKVTDDKQEVVITLQQAKDAGNTIQNMPNAGKVKNEMQELVDALQRLDQAANPENLKAAALALAQAQSAMTTYTKQQREATRYEAQLQKLTNTYRSMGIRQDPKEMMDARLALGNYKRATTNESRGRTLERLSQLMATANNGAQTLSAAKSTYTKQSAWYNGLTVDEQSLESVQKLKAALDSLSASTKTSEVTENLRKVGETAKAAQADVQAMGNILKDYNSLTSAKGFSLLGQQNKDALQSAFEAFNADKSIANMDALRTAIDGANEALNKIRDNKALEHLSAQGDAAKQKLDALSKQNGGFNQWGAEAQTAFTEATRAYEDFKAALDSGNIDQASASLQKMKDQTALLGNEMRETAKAAPVLADGVRQLLGIGAGLMSLRSGFNILKKMATEVTSVDTAMTELRKVTDETAATYARFQSEAGSTAREIGSSISDLINTTADFAKMGYTTSEATQLGRTATMFARVGDFGSASDASDALISVLRGFNLAASEAGGISDRLNEIGNKYAVTAADVAQGLENSSAALKVAGNNSSQAMAMITAIAEVTRDASGAGNALKTLSMRLRGAKTEMTDAGEDTEGMAESTSKLREQVAALTNVTGKGGFDIMADENTFKNTYEILQGIAKVWGDMTDANRASLLELIAGKVRGSQTSALLENWERVEAIYQTAMNAEGSMEAEHQNWIESIEARQEKLQAAWQNLSQTVLNSDVVKFAYDAITSLLDGLNGLASALGSGGSIAALLGTITAIGFAGKESGILSQIMTLGSGGSKISAGLSDIGTGAAAAGKGLTAMLTGGAKIAVLVGAIALISKGVKWFDDNFVHRLEHLQEIADTKWDSFEQATSQVESLNNELETTRQKIEDLQSQGELDFAGKQTLANLKLAEQSLEQQKALAEDIAKVSARKAFNAVNDVQVEKGNRQSSNFLHDWLLGRPFERGIGLQDATLLSRSVKSLIDDTKLGLQTISTDELPDISRTIHDYIKQFEQEVGGEVNIESLTAYYNGNAEEAKETADYYSQALQAYRALLYGTGDSLSVAAEAEYDAIQRYLQAANRIDDGAKLLTGENSQFADTVQRYVGYMSAVGVNTQEETAQHLLSSLLGENVFSDVSKRFVELAEDGDLTAEEFENVRQESELLSAVFDACGITADTAAEALARVYVAANSAADALITIADHSFDTRAKAVEKLLSQQSTAADVFKATGFNGTLSEENYKKLTKLGDKDIMSAVKYANGTLMFDYGAFDAIMSGKYQKQVDALYTDMSAKQQEYIKLTDELATAVKAAQDAQAESNADEMVIQETIIKQKLESLKAVQDEIDGFKRLATQIESATSAYTKWQHAHSAPQEGDMYDDLLTAYQDLQEGFKSGRVGNASYQAAQDFWLANGSYSDKNVQKMLARYGTKGDEDTGAGARAFQADMRKLGIIDANGRMNPGWSLESVGKAIGAMYGEGIELNAEAVKAMLGEINEFIANEADKYNIPSVADQTAEMQSVYYAQFKEAQGKWADALQEYADTGDIQKLLAARQDLEAAAKQAGETVTGVSDEQHDSVVDANTGAVEANTAALETVAGAISELADGTESGGTAGYPTTEDGIPVSLDKSGINKVTKDDLIEWAVITDSGELIIGVRDDKEDVHPVLLGDVLSTELIDGANGIKDVVINVSDQEGNIEQFKLGSFVDVQQMPNGEAKVTVSSADGTIKQYTLPDFLIGDNWDGATGYVTIDGKPGSEKVAVADVVKDPNGTYTIYAAPGNKLGISSLVAGATDDGTYLLRVKTVSEAKDYVQNAWDMLVKQYGLNEEYAATQELRGRFFASENSPGNLEGLMSGEYSFDEYYERAQAFLKRLIDTELPAIEAELNAESEAAQSAAEATAEVANNAGEEREVHVDDVDGWRSLVFNATSEAAKDAIQSDEEEIDIDDVEGLRSLVFNAITEGTKQAVQADEEEVHYNDGWDSRSASEQTVVGQLANEQPALDRIGGLISTITKELENGLEFAAAYDVGSRPIVRNADGSISTVRSETYGSPDGVLANVTPILPNGKVLDSDWLQGYVEDILYDINEQLEYLPEYADAFWDNYSFDVDGETFWAKDLFLQIFDGFNTTIEDAVAAAEEVHERQEQQLSQLYGNGGLQSDIINEGNGLEVTFTPATEEAEQALDGLKSEAEEGATLPVGANTEAGKSSIDSLVSYGNGKQINIPVNISYNGDTNATGTKGAKGGMSLVDEEGAELIEHVSRGTYELGTNNGARFTQLDPGDIVHTAEETKKIKSRGLLGRISDAFRNGGVKTGGAYRMAAKDPLVNRTIANYFANLPDGTLSNGANIPDNDGTKKKSNSGKKKAKDYAKDALEWASSLVDWIPIALDIMQKHTQDYINAAEDAVGYFSKNSELTSAIENTYAEIDLNRRAVERYKKQADDFAKRSNLSADIVNLIHEGTIDINEYDENTRKVISEYQKWWDKAKGCLDTIEDLNDQVYELSIQKLDNVVTYFENIDGLLNDQIESFNSLIEVKNAYGREMEKTDYVDAIRLTQDVISNLEDEQKALRDEIEAQVSSGILKVGSDDWYEYASRLEQVNSTLADAKISLAELKDDMTDIPLNNIKTGLSYLENVQSTLEGLEKLRTAQGSTQQVNTYRMMISNGMKEIENLEMQNEQIREQMTGLDTLSDKYQNLLKQLNDNNSTILDIKASQEQWNDAVIDLKIDFLQKQNEKYQQRLDLMKAINDLEDARQRRILTYRDGQGFVYEADEDAVEDATEGMATQVHNAIIQGLEDAKSDDNIYDAIGNLLSPVADALSDIDFSDYYNRINKGAEDSTLLNGLLNNIKMSDIIQGSMGGTVNIDLSGMTLEGVNDAQTLGDAIIAQLPGYITQYLYQK